MANGKTHLVIGATVGLIVILADRKKHEISHHPLMALTLGALFGKLPDILEPSLRNPHHRQFYHSLLVLGALGIGLKQIYDWYPDKELQQFLRGLLLVSGCAYVSHLLCDFTTPRSLPLVGKIN